MPKAKRRPLTAHPGAVLRETIRKRGISLNKLSRDTRIPISGISLIANGKRSITAETALRLARYLGGEPRDWTDLQAAYEIELARKRHGKLINREVSRAAAA